AAGGKAIAVAVGTAGTPIYVSTAGASYTGNLIDLQANGASKFSVNELGKITGPTTGAFAIDNGNASAINIGNASGLAPINIGTANASTVTIGRSTQATVVNGTLQSVGDFTVGSPVKLTITAATGDVTAAGFGLFGSSAANQIKLLGAANGSPVQIAALGASDLNVGIQLVPKGTGRV